MSNTYKIVIATAAILSGCATKPFDTSASDFHPPVFSLANFKSPESRPAPQLKQTAVVLAISGGGHRAANFGIGVLRGLEKIQCSGAEHNALQEVDYLSTASGGGIAAAIYLTTLKSHLQQHGDYTGYRFANASEAFEPNARRDHKTNIIRAIFDTRFLGNKDRGDALERDFSEMLLTTENGSELTLRDIFIPVDSTESPVLPIFIPNSTVFQTGEIFPYYPDTLRAYGLTEYTHKLHKKTIEQDDFLSAPVSLGLKASATFPAGLPATTLRSNIGQGNKFVHLFDGGLADNLGITTALQILGGAAEPNKVLITVDASREGRDPFSSEEGSPNIPQVLERTMSITVDANRNRAKWTADQVAKSMNAKSVYLSFDDIENPELSQHVRVPTNFGMKDTVQAELIKAGISAVHHKRDELVAAIFGKVCK